MTLSSLADDASHPQCVIHKKTTLLTGFTAAFPSLFWLFPFPPSNQTGAVRKNCGKWEGWEGVQRSGELIPAANGGLDSVAEQHRKARVLSGPDEIRLLALGQTNVNIPTPSSRSRN